MSRPIELSIILPAYKEKENLAILIPQIQAEFLTESFEIIVVDDNSKDGTRELVSSMGDLHKNIFLIERAGLMGIGSALRDGYNRAQGQYILSADSDLSFTTSDMRNLFEKIKTGPDLVLGYKLVPEHIAPERREKKLITQHMRLPIGNFCNWIVRKASGIGNLKDYNTNFRIMRRSLWQKLVTREDRNFFLFETILQASRIGANIVEMPVLFYPRKFGESKLNFIGQAPGYFLTLLRTTVLNKNNNVFGKK